MKQSIEKKLNNLLKLQKIDSNIYEIKKVRGALPEEVQDLEDELIGYNTRQEKYNDEINNFQQDIEDLKNKVSNAKKLIKNTKSNK